MQNQSSARKRSGCVLSRKPIIVYEVVSAVILVPFLKGWIIFDQHGFYQSTRASLSRLVLVFQSDPNELARNKEEKVLQAMYQLS